ncbi:MAG: hypothetical protein M0R17_06190 [Candidatus Omnitrophica bacterium]|jgi:hypothetical protein|nr:hypothetical protein [Candidatus Omnitrophota bacterium]
MIKEHRSITMPTFLLKRNLQTKTKKFYDGWTKEDFEKEYLKISMNISTLTKAQRQFIINSFKNAKDKNNKTPDNINK